jgi:hypothetical protein
VIKLPFFQLFKEPLGSFISSSFEFVECNQRILPCRLKDQLHEKKGIRVHSWYFGPLLLLFGFAVCLKAKNEKIWFVNSNSLRQWKQKELDTYNIKGSFDDLDQIISAVKEEEVRVLLAIRPLEDLLDAAPDLLTRMETCTHKLKQKPTNFIAESLKIRKILQRLESDLMTHQSLYCLKDVDKVLGLKNGENLFYLKQLSKRMHELSDRIYKLDCLITS